MFKRMLLVSTFITALGAAGLAVTTKATAWDDCSGGYRTAYYPTYSAYYPSYPTYYGYGPSAAYYRAPVVVRNYGFHDGHHDYHHHDHNRISFSFGF